MRTILGVVAFLLVWSTAFANDYWVSPSGSDLNPGTQALPFREIRAAIAIAGAGDAIHVLDGSYLGFDVANKACTVNSPLIIKAEGAGANVIVTTDRSDNRDTIHLLNCSYVVLDGFRARNANRAGCRVDACNHVTVKNCVFAHCTTWGLFTNQSDDIVIDGNECDSSQVEHGIYFSNSGDRPQIRNNRIHDNNANGLHMNGDISIQPGDGIITGALVEGNIIWNNGNAGGGGINCDGVQSSTFRNNVLYNNHASGIILYQIDGGGPPNNNTIVNNSIDMASNGRWAISVHDGGQNTVIFNNIMLTHNPVRGSLHFDGAASMVGLQSNYNVFTTIANVATVDDDATYDTFAEWQARGYDANSFQATQAATYVNAQAGDLHLVPSSGAVNGGVSSFAGKSAPTVDYEGGTRSAPFDIGADELGVTAGVPDPVGTGNPLRLLASRPNPFRGATRISFELAQPGRVGIRIFDATGRLVHRFDEGDYAPGRHELELLWDGTDPSGNSVPAGIYYIQLESRGSTSTRTLVRLR